MMPLGCEPSAAIDRALAAFWAGPIDEFCQVLSVYAGEDESPDAYRELLSALRWHGQWCARRRLGRRARQDANAGA